MFVAAVVAPALMPAAYGQKLPGTIRGYKVDHAKTIVVNDVDASTSNTKSDLSIKIKAPSIADLTFKEAVFEVDAEFTATHSGKVDLITFHDFQVNGIPCRIDDAATPFVFKKNKAATMPSPARISVSLASISRAIYKQLSESPDDLAVTGTVFVFGRFKKFGIGFKRVIPIAIDLKIKNPLHTR